MPPPLAGVFMPEEFNSSRARTRTHEGSGERVNGSVITTKVKAASFNEPGLKVSEIKR